MSAGKPPPKPPWTPGMAAAPPRARVPSVREDPRRDPEPEPPPPDPPPTDAELRRATAQLMNLGLVLGQVLPKILESVEATARGVGILVARGDSMRPKSDSRLDLEVEVARLRAGIVDEIVKGESVRAKAMLVRWTGAAVIEGGKQLWRARVAALVFASLVGIAGYVTRDCQGHWPVRVSVNPPAPPAAAPH